MGTIFITGGAGFIGSNFIRYYLEEHPESFVVNYDLLTYAGTLTSLKDVIAKYGERYRFIKGDIANYDFLMHVFEEYSPEYVVNFAAESHNSRAVLNPSIFYKTNVLGTQKLLEACRDARVPRFHHISTCEVYGDLALDDPRSFSEDSPYQPHTPYNASKAGADHAIRAYAETFRLPVTISNSCNNYGPYQFPEKVIPVFAIRALDGKQLPLYRSSKNRREWLYVDDHSRAIDAILHNGKVGDTYNVGSGIELDVEAIADSVLESLGLDKHSYKTYVPDRPSHDRRYLLNSSKIRTQLGWSPKVAVTEGIPEVVYWYRDNRWWWEPLLRKLEVDEEGWSSVDAK